MEIDIRIKGTEEELDQVLDKLDEIRIGDSDWEIIEK